MDADTNLFNITLLLYSEMHGDTASWFAFTDRKKIYCNF